MKTVKFSDWNCKVNILEYNNGGTAITLNDVNDGAPVATAGMGSGIGI